MIEVYKEILSIQSEEKLREIEKRFYEIRDRKYKQVTELDFILVHVGKFTLAEVDKMSIVERQRYLELLREFQEKERESLKEAKLNSGKRG